MDIVFMNNTLRDYAICLGIILGVLIFNRFISKRINHLLYKAFRRLTVESLAEDFSKLLLKPMELLILLFAILFAIQHLNYPVQFEMELFGTQIKKILVVLYKLSMALSFMWLSLRIVEFIAKVLAARAEKTDNKLDDQLVPFLKDFLKVMVWTTAILFILSSILKLNVTSLLAGIGIGGLALAFAAQDSLANLLSSIFIFLDRPFVVGDYVQAGGITGTVEKVGFRSTRIRTLDKTVVTIPNKKIMEEATDNMTLRNFRRVRSMIGLTYSTTKEQMDLIINDIQDYLNKHTKTNMDGVVGFYEFGPSSLDLIVQYYIEMMDWNPYVKVKEEINFKIMEIVKKHKADFAFPTTTVHLHQEK